MLSMARHAVFWLFLLLAFASSAVLASRGAALVLSRPNVLLRLGSMAAVCAAAVSALVEIVRSRGRSVAAWLAVVVAVGLAALLVAGPVVGLTIEVLRHPPARLGK
jgi:ribose/xylose/arabinose/galactoside ABC-type transport system permease subunit